jgi:dipeptidyl-peptidase 4
MTPVNTWLYDASTDQPVLTWEINTNTSQVLEEYYHPQNINLTVPIAGGFEANVRMFIPPELDLVNGTDLKYPMVVDIYPGPNALRTGDGVNLGIVRLIIEFVIKIDRL